MHVVASLLKQYFRDLPEPLLPTQFMVQHPCTRTHTPHTCTHTTHRHTPHTQTRTHIHTRTHTCTYKCTPHARTCAYLIQGPIMSLQGEVHPIQARYLCALSKCLRTGHLRLLQTLLPMFQKVNIYAHSRTQRTQHTHFTINFTLSVT